MLFTRFPSHQLKAHFRVTLSVPTFAVATVPLLVFIMYRDLATQLVATNVALQYRENESYEV